MVKSPRYLTRFRFRTRRVRQQKLVTELQHFGGRRWWFVCSRTDQLAARRIYPLGLGPSRAGFARSDSGRSPREARFQISKTMIDWERTQTGYHQPGEKPIFCHCGVNAPPWGCSPPGPSDVADIDFPLLLEALCDERSPQPEILTRIKAARLRSASFKNEFQTPAVGGVGARERHRSFDE
jgi:hypothetical protein